MVMRKVFAGLLGAVLLPLPLMAKDGPTNVAPGTPVTITVQQAPAATWRKVRLEPGARRPTQRRCRERDAARRDALAADGRQHERHEGVDAEEGHVEERRRHDSGGQAGC
jgi:hypothetical protein